MQELTPSCQVVLQGNRNYKFYKVLHDRISLQGLLCEARCVQQFRNIAILCLGPIGDFCIGDGEMYNYARDASRCLAILSIKYQEFR